MAQPGLELGNVRLMLQGIYGCRREQPKHAKPFDLVASLLGIGLDERIDTIGRDPYSFGPVTQRHKYRRFRVDQMMP